MSNAVDLILDSGAFSAWKKQIEIPLGKYIDFALDHADCVKEVVNLDTIPGAWGSNPSADDIEKAALKSFTNAVAMRKAGVRVMPVFHMRERMYWLERMVDEGFGYIGLAPVNNRPVKDKVEWLDKAFGVLCGKKGFPTVKTHAFGASSNYILHRYPWFTADSLSWIRMASNGWAVFPRKTAGEYDYTAKPVVIHISGQSRAVSRNKHKQQSTAQRHFNNMGTALQELALEYFGQNGWTLKQLADDLDVRIKTFLRFTYRSSMASTIRPFRRPFNLFAGSKYGATTPLNDRFTFFFSTCESRQYNEILQVEKLRNRLFSYYYWAFGPPPFSLREYIRTGSVPAKIKKAVKA